MTKSRAPAIEAIGAGSTVVVSDYHLELASRATRTGIAVPAITPDSTRGWYDI